MPIPNHKTRNHNAGFTLVELIVSLFVLTTIFIGVYSLIVLSVKLNVENKYIVEATAVANQRMERIRNMPYSQVGCTSCSPAGPIPQVETVVQDGTYTVRTYITYFIDPFDGIAMPQDPVINDYKIVTIKVSWQGKWGSRSLSFFTKIIPRTEETGEGLGLLKIYTVDSTGAALPSANVKIINTALAINQDLISDQAGILYYPAPPSYMGYKVIVTKTDVVGVPYGTDQTYATSTTNPQPTKMNLSVTEGNKTEESFSIDKLATLRIHTVGNNKPENWQVNASQSDTVKSNARAAIDSSDDLYFAWQASNATSSTVYTQKYNSSAVRQWAVDNTISSTKFQRNPDIVTTANGRSFIVWQDDSINLKATTIALGPESHIAGQNNPASIPRISSADINEEPLNLLAYLKTTVNNNFISIQNIATKLADKMSFNLNSLKVAFANAIKKSWKNLKYPIMPPMPALADLGTVTFVGVSAGAVTGNGTNNISLAVPAGVQVGDLLLAYIHHDDHSDGPMVPPAGQGWQIANNNLQPSGCLWWNTAPCDSRGGIFWKIVAAGDPANYTFTLQSGNNEEKAGHIRAYRGVDTASPFDGSIAIHTTGTGERYHDAPTHTVSNDGSMLICGWGTDDITLGGAASIPAFPVGMTANTRNNFGTNVTAATADMSVGISNSPTGNKRFDAEQNVNQRTIDWSLVLKPAVLPDDATVSASGSQLVGIVIPATDQNLEGVFVIIDNTGSHTVASVTITENGTVDADSDLENVRLFYDIDSTAPYDCAGESYAITDTQFGAITVFSGDDGTAVFTPVGGVNISTVNTLCLYTVLDVSAGASKDETIEIEIANPSTDVVLSSGTVIPGTQIQLSGATNLLTPASLEQIHYRWRLDNGNESADPIAGWQAGQDTPGSIKSGSNIRLRFSYANIGSLPSPAVNYRLEYGQKISDCSAVAAWSEVPNDNSAHWRMSDSTFFTDGDATEDLSGLSNLNSNFVAGQLLDTSNATAPITLTGTDFTEIEYAIQATSNANEDPYCFRLTNNGLVANFHYAIYPEISIYGDNNIYLIGLATADGSDLWPIKRVNIDVASEEQTNPRIALAENGGHATTVIAWEDGRNGDSDIYAQVYDEDGNKWKTNFAVANTPGVIERQPALTVNGSNEINIIWMAEESDNNVYWQKFDLDGSPLNAPVNLAISSPDHRLQIVAGESDMSYIALTSLDAADKNVRIYKLNTTGGIEWSRTANVESPGYDQYSPALYFRNNLLYVAWTDKREGNEDIYVQKFNISGTAQWTNDQRINIHTDPSNQNTPSLLISSTDSPYGAWSDARDGASNIFATEFGDPSATSGVGGVPIIITGTSRIGENPVIYEYSNSFTTDGSGNLNLSVEWDSPGYTIVLDGASPLNLVFSEPTQPIVILPAESLDVNLYVE